MPVEAMNLAWWPKATPVVRPLCSGEGRQVAVTASSGVKSPCPIPAALQTQESFLFAGGDLHTSPPTSILPQPPPLTCEVEDFRPLLADVDLDVRPTQSQVGAALVKDERLHLWRRRGTKLQNRSKKF